MFGQSDEWILRFPNKDCNVDRYCAPREILQLPLLELQKTQNHIVWHADVFMANAMIVCVAVYNTAIMPRYVTQWHVSSMARCLAT